MIESRIARNTALVVGLGVCLICAPRALAVELPPAQAPSVQRGVQIPDVGALNRLNVTKFDFSWIKFQYAPGDKDMLSKVKAAKVAGKKVMVSVAKNPTGASLPSTDPVGDQCRDDADATSGYVVYRQFMEKTAKELGSNVDAYEIMNEPNKEGEWNDKMGLGSYSLNKMARLLECGAKGVKAGNPSAKVITPGFSPNPDGDRGNDVSSITGMLDGLDLNNIDFIGAHLYLAKDVSPENDQSDFGYLGGLVAAAAPSGKKIWVSEWGVQRCAAGNIPVSRQINYLDKGFEVAAKKYSSVEGMVVWNFGYAKASANREFACYDIEGGAEKKPGLSSKYIQAPDAEPVPHFKVGVVDGEAEVVYVPKAGQADCVVNPKNATKAGPTNQLNTPTFENDVVETNLKLQVGVPQSVYNDQGANENTHAGLQKPFSLQEVVQQLGCFLFNIGCVPDVQLPKLANDQDSRSGTSVFAQKSQIEGLTQLPAGIDLEPGKNDCDLVDIVEKNTGEKAVGNQDLNAVSAFSTNGLGLAKVSNRDQMIAECVGKDNFVIGNKQSVQDERVCAKEVDDFLMKRANYPPGVEPLPETKSQYINELRQNL